MNASRLIRLLCCVAGILAIFPQPVAAKDKAAEPKFEEAPLTVANRDITIFRSALLGAPPDARAARAAARINALEYNELAIPVTARATTLGDLHGYSILVGDRVMFTLQRADLDPEDNLPLEQVAEQARKNLELALRAKREQAQWPVLLRGVAHAAGVSAVLALLLWGFHRVGHAIVTRLRGLGDRLATPGAAVQWREYLVRLLIKLLTLGRWVVVLLLSYAWLTWVLDHFPVTEPLGRGLANFVVTSLENLAEAGLSSLPGIVTIVVIVFVARAIVQVIGQFFDGVQAGRTQVSFLHRDTASATRRIVVFIAWALALAVCYPFIPGSSSDVFKGLSVLLGVVVSLGSTGLVTQMMSGLVIVYSRAMRKGDYVKIGEVEGMVTEVGAFATKIVTMRNEEVTIPNASLTGNAIHNFSTLAGADGTLLSTKVTIGYDAPWRQVHAMLEEAAERTPGLRPTPKPVVYQRALSDFYAEYELFVHMDNPLARVATLSVLHGNIQDAFNEHGVQILSPHFVLQPKSAVVVPPDKWYPPPARPPAK